ncbi:dihydrofolate reductase [endosymbiont GvMRE of Glomus versiforme]|uniref:dihydrofolate reductase n=1 Tax=endosymbiont GvMRE of Glomus versiforme TaxID=2039283 RepID=UPI000ED3FEFB|nr:dihydrofolate reductase [endosymbiont GvMRE of Glomus versiforme]RHZ36843.1 Dihydrofolate reductase [endosymbiont GvMRE of Glomus versiforme]
MINLIWAMTEEYIIGQDNSLPWKIKEEMQHFAKTTRGHIILMGRKTFESIGKPLPGRHNIVLTKNQEWAKEIKLKYPQLTIENNLASTIQQFSNKSEQLFIIGGKEIFYQTYPFADQLCVSVVKKKYPGNIKLDFFPEMVKNFQLKENKKFSQFIVKIFAKK